MIGSLVKTTCLMIWTSLANLIRFIFCTFQNKGNAFYFYLLFFNNNNIYWKRNMNNIYLGFECAIPIFLSFHIVCCILVLFLQTDDKMNYTTMYPFFKSHLVYLSCAINAYQTQYLNLFLFKWIYLLFSPLIFFTNISKM